MVKGLKFLPKFFRNPDGTLSWRMIASVSYAFAAWSLAGGGFLAYKLGYIKLKEKEEAPTVHIDWNERARIVAEDVAENIYTTADFMG